MSTTEVTRSIEIASICPSETFGVMRDEFLQPNQHYPNWDLAQLHVGTDRVPLCYSRQATSLAIKPQMSTQRKAVLVALTILAAATTILIS
ncbi:MAG TPA: hypothetical protein VNK52_01970 [Hyphomicrobiaceae bacterium]|nr:hypothetical protein [Hyphomicrobiaceae bacterium]